MRTVNRIAVPAEAVFGQAPALRSINRTAVPTTLRHATVRATVDRIAVTA
ncbi:hypothetical protein [Labedaea rhizosphaerae]|nr:hypothetical protein [Labedaea rhizosphaerae]